MSQVQLLIVHPKDATTEFLSEICAFLQSKFKNSVVVYRINCTDSEHEKVKASIENSKVAKILFLGHGSSYSLQGAKNDSYSKEVFISKKELKIFEKKDFLCLSCKSTEFLHRQYNINYVGFGDMPTHMEEITGAREQDNKAYEGVDDDILNEFRSIIVSAITNSTYEWLKYDYSVRDLKNRIRIRLNKEVVRLKIESGDKALISLLKEMKNEISFNFFGVN